ncbi:Rieske (2Fe-2S) protein [Pedobacter sp. SD-b]|uniref:Rieske (2Fe-2S) protein n=1 Tax=Pedobacter segetis TaxID=2793069 RepID=A0ABS1BFB9_9SPHI|nr:Rieske (2Fe-2S) protein [Pedobacter segetis]MBK0381538.1 Rieske (2Fe-2S) protein [Pedobacter segetis]
MKQEKEISESRRNFLMKFSLGLGGIAALLAGIPILGALFQPLIKKGEQKWRVVGKLTDFAKGETQLIKFRNAEEDAWAGVSAKSAGWLRHKENGEFECFSANCTHLGCPVRWEKDAELFMCPCHGGVYYKDGTVAAGPPPKSLTQYSVRVNKGNVEVKTAPIPLTKITA